MQSNKALTYIEDEGGTVKVLEKSCNEVTVTSYWS